MPVETLREDHWRYAFADAPICSIVLAILVARSRGSGRRSFR